MLYRTLKWLTAFVLALPVLAFIWVTIFGWNWARAPLQRAVFEKTGRELVIGGNLGVVLSWPTPRVRAEAVTFANPPWAMEKQMVAAESVEFTVDLYDLLREHLVFPEVRLTRPIIFLEQTADGRKTWLLDRQQADENTRIPIGRLTLDDGLLGYDDAKQNTRIRADISTQDTAAGGVAFSAKGLYKGLVVAAHGSGGSVLALDDESAPFPLIVEATIGHTGIKGDGTVTSLFKLSALDMRLALRGDSLAQLFPLFGLALPETHPYAVAGRILHNGQIGQHGQRGQMWRYEKFSGHTGKSDIAGSLQVDIGGARPFMHGELVSQFLDIDDLGPLIGTKAQMPAPAVRKVARAPKPVASETKKVVVADPVALAGPHMLPDIPFKTDRWNSVDADVTLRARKILHAKDLPLDNLVAHLKMQNSLLTLDPLDFGIADGHLKAVISLDGRQNPIQAHARIGARKIRLAKLFPTVDLTKSSIGQINGEFDLAGTGNSVGRMLATANGRVGLIIAMYG